MKTVLVSGASGIVGYGILRSLRASGGEYRLIGTSIYPDSIANAFCDEFVQAPRTADPAYEGWLWDTIRTRSVDLAVPGIECDLYLWNGLRERFRDAGCVPALNRAGLVEMCRDKWDFYSHLRPLLPEYCIPTALAGGFDALAQSFGLPFLLKPRRGYASQGIRIVRGVDDFASVAGELGQTLMAQPVVGADDQEYTTAAFCDADGSVCASMTLRRRLSSSGFTEKAEVVEDPDIESALRDLATALRPVGPTNFQFRKQDGKVVLLEVNPRISSSTSIRAAFGYNESRMAADFHLDGVVPTQPSIRRGHAIRYTEDHIFYEDRPAV